MDDGAVIENVNRREKPAWDDDVERLVLYADFMGFKNRVYSMEHVRLKKMVEAFNFSWRNRLRSLHAGEDLKFVQFSDSILMVVNGSDNAMFNLLTKAAICMMHEALKIQFGIKGVIAQGIFSFDESKGLFLGRPLIDAYLLHEEIKYYGIVVHHTAENIVKNNMSRANPYSKNDIYIDKGKVAQYHLCWNLLDENLMSNDITSQCNAWLDTIGETVSGNARQYIDKTRDVMERDRQSFAFNDVGMSDVRRQWIHSHQLIKIKSELLLASVMRLV